MCQHHYDRARRSGQLAAVPKATAEERFWSRIVKGSEPDDCWTWTGSRTANGYGHLYVAGRMEYIHRLSFAWHVAPIPDDHEVDHLCRSRGCANWLHLEAVTHRENLLRGMTVTARNAAVTSCPAGHPYDLANTYVDPSGGRRCRRCAYIRTAQRSQSA
jgi:hypothetical protein